MAEFNIKNFSGGVTDDAEQETMLSFDILRHYSLVESNFKLTPNRDFESDENKSFDITKFLYANSVFHGFGIGTGGSANKLQIYEKIPSISGSWGTSTGGTSTGNGFIGTLNTPFVYRDNVYGFWINSGVGKIFKWGDITGTPSFTDSFGTFSATTAIISNAVIGKDDELYFGHNNFLAQINAAGDYEEKKLILPPEFRIRSVEVWGSYLAIAAAGDGLTVNSKVFLWNYVDAEASLAIDFGREILYMVGNIDGTLIGSSLSDAFASGFSQRLVFKQWSGGETANTLWDRDMGDRGYTIDPLRFIENNSMYFLLNHNGTQVSINPGIADRGIWSFGRKNANFPWRANHDIKAVNDTLVNNVEGWTKLGPFFWIAHSADGSVDRTDDTATGAFDSVTSDMVTEKLSGDEPTKPKRLEAVSVAFDSLPDGGIVTIQYKVDDETSFTTIATATTTGQKVLEAITIEGAGRLPVNWNEIQFKVTSNKGNVTGCIIKGLRAKYEFMTTKLD